MKMTEKRFKIDSPRTSLAKL